MTAIFKWMCRAKSGDVKDEVPWTFSYQDCFKAALHSVDTCIFTIRVQSCTKVDILDVFVYTS
jgi:hypothetical protein